MIQAALAFAWETEVGKIVLAAAVFAALVLRFWSNWKVLPIIALGVVVFLFAGRLIDSAVTASAGPQSLAPKQVEIAPSTQSATAAAPEPTKRPIRTTHRAKVNVRSCAAETCDVVGRLPSSTMVFTAGETKTDSDNAVWIKVSTQSSYYCEPTGPCSLQRNTPELSGWINRRLIVKE